MDGGVYAKALSTSRRMVVPAKDSFYALQFIFSRLTDDALIFVEGKHDELIGRLQKRPGKGRMKSASDPCP
jgi:hypothetical protein